MTAKCYLCLVTLLPPPPKVMGDYVFAGVGMLVCEQLPGADSSPVVTKLRQSYPWPQGMRWLNFGKSRSVGEVCALLNALLVLLMYHAVSSLRGAGISFIVEDTLVYIYQYHQISQEDNLQCAAEHYWCGDQRVEKAIESVYAWRWKTFRTLIMSLCYGQIKCS